MSLEFWKRYWAMCLHWVAGGAGFLLFVWFTGFLQDKQIEAPFWALMLLLLVLIVIWLRGAYRIATWRSEEEQKRDYYAQRPPRK